MTATLAARTRKFQDIVGDEGRGKVYRIKDGTISHEVKCRTCRVGHDHYAWVTTRRGPTSFRDALDHWIFHLAAHHPDSSAPCLAHMEDARQRARLADTMWVPDDQDGS